MSSVELELIPAIILPQYVLSPKRYVLIRILPEGAKSNALYQNPATMIFCYKTTENPVTINRARREES